MIFLPLMCYLFLTAMVATRKKQKRGGTGFKRKTNKPRISAVFNQSVGKDCIRLIAGHWTKYCATPLVEEPGNLY